MGLEEWDWWIRKDVDDQEGRWEEPEEERRARNY